MSCLAFVINTKLAFEEAGNIIAVTAIQTLSSYEKWLNKHNRWKLYVIIDGIL